METEAQEMNLPPEYAEALAKEQELAYDIFLKTTHLVDSPTIYHAFIASWCGAFGWGTDAEYHYG